MRSLSTALVFFLLALALLGQTDRGTMTGTISDPAGAVVANAAIEARNTETGSVYQVASSATGNYTIPNLPTGTYELSVTVAGFKKFVRAGLVIQAAQTIRVDAAMEVGSATESVTVTEAAPLLKTESGELSNTVATKTMDTLPLLSVGSNSSGIRNPFNLVALLPGAFYQPSPSFTGPPCASTAESPDRRRFWSTAWTGPTFWAKARTSRTSPAWIPFRSGRFKPATTRRNSAKPAARS